MRFKEDGVKELLAKVFLPWINAYRFFEQQCALLKKESDIDFKYDPETKYTNVMDRWVLASTQSLIQFVKQEMTGKSAFFSVVIFYDVIAFH